MEIRIYIDDDTPLEECPKAEFAETPRAGDVIRVKSGEEYEIASVQWRIADGEPAIPTITVSSKYRGRGPA